MRGTICMVVAALLLAACGSGEPRAEVSGSKVRLLKADTQRIGSSDTTEGQVARLVRGNNDFAFDLYRAEAGDGNLIFSPYSISLAFSMAYAGARATPAADYGAGLRAIGFGQPEEASEEINGWVADETEGRIEDLVPPDVIDPASTRLILTNAVYFKASWLSRFERSKTQDGPFARLDGSETTVPMMRQRAYLDYTEGEGYRAVRLPYEGEAADMLVILPDGGRFGSIERRLEAGFLDEVRRGLDTAVDEKGTEAAAATMLAMAVTAAPPVTETNMDRPFIFAIVEKETGTILFLGRVTNP